MTVYRVAAKVECANYENSEINHSAEKTEWKQESTQTGILTL
jgi:hypothetical protein